MHANCIESPVIMKPSPCTNPHNSRSRQHTIAGDHVPMTKPLSMITRFHFFLPLVRRFTCPVQRLQEFSDQVFASHLFFRRQLNRHLTGFFSLTMCPRSIQEQDLPSRRTTCPGFHISALESKNITHLNGPIERTFLASSGPSVRVPFHTISTSTLVVCHRLCSCLPITLG